MTRAPVSAALLAALLGVLVTGCGGGETRAATPAPGTATVVGVADGDTAFVEIDGARETVRLVGIDAPESDGPYRAPGCFGPQAARRLRELLPSGAPVRVETDPAQRSTRDRFDRLLAYVYRRGEEISVNRRLLEEGMARVFVFRDDPFGRIDAFRSAEDVARRAGVGLWGACGSRTGGPAGATTDGRSCPEDAPIKGNLPSRIYHSPGDENYAATNPERCFATADEARTEGFRPAGR